MSRAGLETGRIVANAELPGAGHCVVAGWFVFVFAAADSKAPPPEELGWREKTLKLAGVVVAVASAVENE